jgi:hypothetical protein
MTTRPFNFIPDTFLLERIKKAAQGDWDAGIDLAFRNILYDDVRQMWVLLPEEDFDRRRSSPLTTENSLLPRTISRFLLGTEEGK